MPLCSRALYILATMDIRVIPQLFLTILRSPFFGKRRMHPFVYLSIVFWLYTALLYQSSMALNSLVFHTFAGILSSLAAFLFLISLSTESGFSCIKCPSLMSCWLQRGGDFYVHMLFLTAKVSHGTLSLALCLIGMHSAAASKWALMNFSYSSFGVGVSDISWSLDPINIKIFGDKQ